MTRIVIADANCLISLHNVGELELLRDTFDNVFTTETIANEFKNPLPDWIKVLQNMEPIVHSYFGIDLDAVEASAISIAQEIPDIVLILDDLKARRVANLLSLKFMGTLGVAIQAKQKEMISSIRHIITKLQSAGLCISRQIIEEALEEAGEI